MARTVRRQCQAAQGAEGGASSQVRFNMNKCCVDPGAWTIYEHARSQTTKHENQLSICTARPIQMFIQEKGRNSAGCNHGKMTEITYCIRHQPGKKKEIVSGRSIVITNSGHVSPDRSEASSGCAIAGK